MERRLRDPRERSRPYGNARHNVTIEAAGIDIDLEPGERPSVRLQAFGDDPIDALCRFHGAAGMIAKITVR